MPKRSELSVICGSFIGRDSVGKRGWLSIRGDAIEAIGLGVPPSTPAIDVGELVLAPGFIDLHVHGAAGGQAAGDDAAAVREEVLRAARFHATHGTTTLLATTVSDRPERLLATLDGVRAAIETDDALGARIAGVHLEGPWIAAGRRGAHDPSTLRSPTLAELDALISAGDGCLQLLTMAPELPGALEVISAAVKRGLCVSVGHTECTYAQAQAAFAAGASHLTHLGNAMRPLDRREPGPIGAALTDPRVTVEVIADGEHVHPAMLKIVADVVGDRLVAITDAISATGLADGTYLLGTLKVTVRAGRAVLADDPDTLAGSVLTLDRAVATLIAAGVSPAGALHAATAAPASVLRRLPPHLDRGRLAPGVRADLVVLDDQWRARATVIAGRVAHDPEGMLGRLPAGLD